MKYASIIAICTAISLSAGVQAKELFVDGAAGDDATSYADNSSSRPWRTVGRAVWGGTTISSRNASQAAQAGDVVIVRDGIYETTASTGERFNPVYNPTNSGRSGAPIVFRAQTAGQVHLRASNSGAGQPIIGSYGKSYITWDGFVIDEQYVPTRADTGPVVAWTSNNILFQNLNIRTVNKTWADNHNGIRLEDADQITIRNNIITGPLQPGYNWNATGIMMYDVHAVTIENNSFSSANAGIYAKTGVWGPLIIRYNTFRDITQGILFFDVGNAGASPGAQVYSNILYNVNENFLFNFHNSRAPANVSIVNNTIVSPTGAAQVGVQLRSNYLLYRNVRVSNNIFTRSHIGISFWDGASPHVTSSYNNFHSVGSCGEVAFVRQLCSLWRALGFDTTGSREVNPMYVNEAAGNFALQSSSPLRNAAPDFLDLNRNGSTTDLLSFGAYAVGNETIGASTSVAPLVTPNPPSSVSVN